MIKIYVAGASAEMERAEAAMEMIDGDDRMKVTHNWVQSFRAAPTPDHLLQLSARRHHSRMDMEAIDHADLVWLLVPVLVHSTGCWVELGYALKGCKTVITSGETAQSIFTAHTFEVVSDEVAWERIQELAGWYR